jgi:hypothetical protein
MQKIEQLKEVRFDNFPEVLIKFSWDAIWTRGFVVFHLENSFLNFFLCVEGS